MPAGDRGAILAALRDEMTEALSRLVADDLIGLAASESRCQALLTRLEQARESPAPDEPAILRAIQEANHRVVAILADARQAAAVQGESVRRERASLDAYRRGAGQLPSGFDRQV